MNAARFWLKRRSTRRGQRELCRKGKHARWGPSFMPPIGYRCTWCRAWGLFQGDY